MSTHDLTVVRTIEIERPAADVFALFAQRPATWWPLGQWSHGDAPAVALTFDARVGGRIYDTDAEGREAQWGTVTAWDPPHHLTFDYSPFKDERMTEVELWFEPLTATRTRVRLTHRGWERHGEDGAKRSRGYAAGWQQALDLLAGAATTTAATRGDLP